MSRVGEKDDGDGNGADHQRDGGMRGSGGADDAGVGAASVEPDGVDGEGVDGGGVCVEVAESGAAHVGERMCVVLFDVHGEESLGEEFRVRTLLQVGGGVCGVWVAADEGYFLV